VIALRVRIPRSSISSLRFSDFELPLSSFGSAFALYAAGCCVSAPERGCVPSSDAEPDELGRDFGQSLDAALRPANLDRELLGS
jgi:hypothetical protein